jgi:hypothetical protein
VEIRVSDQGVTGDDLDRQVNASLAILTFDGDTIAADQRALYEDPEAIERIDPDTAGRYVVMGRTWCWLPVDPADCDRIVGDLPAPGEQQQFVALIHTPGMRLPDDRLRIQVEQEWLTATGLAFTATLTLDGAPVASIRDHGDGQGVRFDTADGESGWPGMIEYLRSCRYRGAPVSQQRLLDALVDERYVTAAVTAARADGQTVVRLVDHAGRTRVLGPVPPPRNWPARQELAHALANAAPNRTGEWQIWGGNGWAYLASVADNTRPSTGNEAAVQPCGEATG